MFGFLNVNKPAGITSRDAVNQIQRLVRPNKVGHAGTLDPLATGVLVVCIGPATRLASYVQSQTKSYIGNFRLGLVSDTEDIEGNVEPLPNAPSISQSQILDVLPGFVGQIQQLPPRYSALKLNGKRAYQLARKGHEFTLQPRIIQIHNVQLTRFDFPDFEIEVQCGSGTYIRSIGRDIGKKLGSNAVMTDLQRTGIGSFQLDNAMEFNTINLDSISANLDNPATHLLNLNSVQLTDREVDELSHGKFWTGSNEVSDNELIAVDGKHNLICILKKVDHGKFRPGINFSGYWRSRGQNPRNDTSK
ncbi:MAG: tRNA pseudouridine(55) synthase TruB [Planctomycetota bacterium]